MIKVPCKARRAPAVALHGVRRMAILVISSDKRQSRRAQMSVAQRVTRPFRPTAQKVQRRVPRTNRRYSIGPRRVTPPARLLPRTAKPASMTTCAIVLRPDGHAPNLDIKQAISARNCNFFEKSQKNYQVTATVHVEVMAKLLNTQC